MFAPQINLRIRGLFCTSRINPYSRDTSFCTWLCHLIVRYAYQYISTPLNLRIQPSVHATPLNCKIRLSVHSYATYSRDTSFCTWLCHLIVRYAYQYIATPLNLRIQPSVHATPLNCKIRLSVHSYATYSRDTSFCTWLCHLIVRYAYQYIATPLNLRIQPSVHATPLNCKIRLSVHIYAT